MDQSAESRGEDTPDRTAASNFYSNRGLSRRSFGKAAVAIGGSTALAACLDWSEDENVPEGVDDPSTLPAGQHHWNDHVGRDRNEDVATPRHHVLLLLDVEADGTPTDTDRETIETALRGLERAYEWSNEGLVFTIGCSPAYFDRYNSSPPHL